MCVKHIAAELCIRETAHLLRTERVIAKDSKRRRGVGALELTQVPGNPGTRILRMCASVCVHGLST